jgi:hypothetical protein
MSDAMKRLGAPLATCPYCGDDFNARHFPRYWVDHWRDGEIVHKRFGKTVNPKNFSSWVGTLFDGDDLCCSERCAEGWTEQLNARVPPKHTDHYTWDKVDDNGETTWTHP